MKNQTKTKNLPPELRSSSAMRLLGSFLQTAYGLSVVGDSGGESECACAAWSFYLINMSSRQSDRRAKGRGEACRAHCSPHWSGALLLASGKATGLKLVSLIEGLLGLMAVAWKFQQTHCLNGATHSPSGALLRHNDCRLQECLLSQLCSPRQPPHQIFLKVQRHFRRALLL